MGTAGWARPLQPVRRGVSALRDPYGPSRRGRGSGAGPRSPWEQGRRQAGRGEGVRDAVARW